MPIRMIAMDIDGTLKNSLDQLTPATKEALLTAQASGVRLALASGRPTPGLMEMARELEMDTHDGLLISYNGARITECQTDEVVYDNAIEPALAREILEHLKSFDVIPMVPHGRYLTVRDVYQPSYTVPGRGAQNIVQMEARMCSLYLHEEPDLAAWVSQPVNKILTAGYPDYLQEHFQEMAAPFSGRASSMFTAAFYYEFTANGVNKGTALRAALPKLGIDLADLMAFGDGENDISMIQAAGTGVAMANAIDALKQAADEVTLSNDQDGIAATLKAHGIA